MNRKEFLKGLGFSAGAIVATYCFGSLTGCKEEGVTPSGTVDFTVDLTDPANAALTAVGGYIRVNNVVIAQTAADVYVAVTQICSHEGEKQVRYRESSNDFYCPAHGARFNTSGNGLNSNGNAGLTVYNVEVNGNNIHVYS